MHFFNTFCFFLCYLSLSTAVKSTASESPREMHIRQNYRKECEIAVNQQITLELQAFHLYRRMAYYFDRSDVALRGFYKFFKKASSEELEHADKLMEYQNKRGGDHPDVSTCINIGEKPSQQWNTVTEAMELALQKEKKITKALLDLRQTAETHSDPHLVDFIETDYLTEQVESIKKLGDYVTTLKRVGSGLGEYMVDRQIEDDAE